MSYDFHQLSPDDFELLVRDLLQAEWGLRLESFKTGRDKGIDFRYARSGHNIIGQVKHYVKTGITGLVRDLKKEVPKLNALNPSRYVFATSVPLSPTAKSAIAAIFCGKLAISDVLGQEDLNNLLATHTEIEKKHYKLWLASRGVLDKLLNSEICSQTEFHVEKVHATICRHVRSEAYQQALDTLDSDRVVIISGAPGVGKTTLANMLLYAHLERDWQPVIIRHSMGEGQKIFQRGKPQIFYYDDFMGATFLGEQSSGMNRSEDRAITDFIEMVRASPDARLILTTREHIFRQGVAVSERLRQAGLDDHKVIIRMGSYSLGQRAKILYNHIHFSDLPNTYKDALLDGDFYLDIVEHPKFNPRLIEWLSSFNRIRKVSVSQYQAFIRNLLNDPSEVWMHAYEQQLSEAGRSLLLAIYSLGGKSEGVVLEAAFKRLHEVRCVRWGLPRRAEDLANAMSELANAFIRPSGKSGFELLDPSVKDLVNSVIRKAPEVAADLVLGAVDFSQIERIWQVAAREIPAIKPEIASIGPEFAAVVRRVILAKNKLVRYSNGIGLIGWTAEGRFASVLSIADGIRTHEMLNLVQELRAALIDEWKSRGMFINDSVDALRSLEATSWGQLRDAVFEAEIADRLIDEAESGCRSDELREIIGVLDLQGPENAKTLSRLQVVFGAVRESIRDEIRDCNNDDDLASLEEDLVLFASALGVDVTREIELVHDEYETGEYYDRGRNRVSDGHQSQERMSEASRDSVRQMFSSLRGDRAD